MVVIDKSLKTLVLKKCLNEIDKLRKKNLRQKKAETYLVICERCNFEKKLCCENNPSNS